MATKHMKRCSTSLIEKCNSELQRVSLHTGQDDHHQKSLQTINAGEGMEKRTLLFCWWKCKLVHPLWRTVWRFLQKWKIGLSYDPAIPLLGIYLNKATIWKDTCTPMFTATLCTIAKTWSQPKCPLTEEWIKKMWYIYTMKYYSAIKKDEITPFATTWVDIEVIILSKSDKEKQISYNIIYMWYLKRKVIQIYLFTKQEQTYRFRKQTYGYQRGKVGRRDKLGGWD